MCLGKFTSKVLEKESKFRLDRYKLKQVLMLSGLIRSN